MFIIWGTKRSQQCLGVAADWCDACQSPQPFTVTSHYNVGHIYYISLGSGTLVGTVRVCWGCGSQFLCRPDQYTQFLSHEQVRFLPIEELVRLTNVPLKLYLDSIWQPQIGPGEATLPPIQEAGIAYSDFDIPSVQPNQ